MFEFSSVEQYHAHLKEGRVTCLQAVEYFLQRIDASCHLNAFIEVYREEAIARATYLDQQGRPNADSGRLHGVVIGLKDVICQQDHQVTASSAILKDFVSVYSATVVKKLLSAGAIIIGRLNCDEFAMGSSNENSCYGKVLNALDETRIPGGSSGGSAVAVQAGLVMASLGSDTGGSVRQPADFCGIIGLKPTYGRISRYGLIAYASSFDQIGIFAKTIPDLGLVLEVIAGADDYDSTVSQLPVQRYEAGVDDQPNYRFAYFKEALEHPGIDPQISTAIKNLIKKLKEDGHTVEAVQFDYLDYIVPAYYVLTTAEASSNLARFDGIKYGYRTSTPTDTLDLFYKQTRSEGFGKEVKRRIMLGTFVLSTGYFEAYFTKAQQVRRLLKDKTRLIFKDFDFILLPTSPSTAFKIGEKSTDPIAMYLADIYTVMANLVGIPAISLPIFRHSNGMPFGLQIMANNFQELPLLQASGKLLQEYATAESQ